MEGNACDQVRMVIAMLSKENPKHPAVQQLTELLVLLCGKAS